MVKYKKNKTNDSELIYKFVVNLREKALFQISIINDLSFIYEICLNADSYIIFINLEYSKTGEKIKNLISYILDKCRSVDITTYFIGFYRNIKNIEYQKEELENLFNEENLNYVYKYTEDSVNHFCFYDFIANEKYYNKKFLYKKLEDYKLFEILEKIINKTYEYTNGLAFYPSEKKYKDEKPPHSCNIL